jgi:primosomal protein N' (replication factor Y)
VIVRVLPDVSGIDKVFDYRVPESLSGSIDVGDVVRVPLHGRSVAGWVLEILGDDQSAHLDRILDVSKWSSKGPRVEVIELARWASSRYAGRLRSLLSPASPGKNVSSLPAAHHGKVTIPDSGVDDGAARAVARPGLTLLVRGPLVDLTKVVAGVLRAGPTIVVMPTHSRARGLAAAMRRLGFTTAVYPDEWARASGGVDIVIGARATVWASVPTVASLLVVDEHDETHQEERMPTWSAREVAIERGRQAGIPVIFTSAVPSCVAAHVAGTVDALDDRWGTSWPQMVVLDRTRDERWGSSLLSSEVIEALRDSQRRVALILNTKGRARLIACGSCRRVVRCTSCDGAMGMNDDGRLVCQRCAVSRPGVCAECGSLKMALVRQGVTRVHEDVAKAAGVALDEVAMVTAGGSLDELSHEHRLIVGTEAVLHRTRDLDDVVLLDIDAELLAPRYRAAESAMALIARSAWAVSRSAKGPRVLVQTRDATHPALRALVNSDIKSFVDHTTDQRRALDLPPFSSLVQLSGEGVGRAEEALRQDMLVQVARVDDETILVKASTDAQLDESLDAAGIGAGGDVRVARDPLRA